MKRLSHTNIEYARSVDGRPGYGWNFYPGCKHGETGLCPVGKHCWAEAMAKRQQKDFHEPHLVPELLLAPLSIKKPSKILVNFMGDLGGEWVEPDKVIDGWTAQGFGSLGTATLKEAVLKVVRARPEHTFLFLTKNPAAWRKWNPWPDNALVGATAWDSDSFDKAFQILRNVEAKHKWMSLEPLLNWTHTIGLEKPLSQLQWLVIGAQTRPDVMPKIEWVKEIVEAADVAGVKVWLKDNLMPLLLTDDGDPHYEKPFCRYLPDQGNGDCYDGHELRQEWPRESVRLLDEAMIGKWPE